MNEAQAQHLCRSARPSSSSARALRRALISPRGSIIILTG